MTNDKILSVTKLYREFLIAKFACKPVKWRGVGYVGEIESPDDVALDVFDNSLWMCNQIDTFVLEGRREKAFRWLGFLQGVFWMLGIYTIDQMADHNRSDTDDTTTRSDQESH